MDSTDNGTYYITDIPSGNTGSVELNAIISEGSFWVEIPADAVAFNTVGVGELHDVFFEHDADGYGVVSKDKKLSYYTISGLQIKDISDDIPTSDIHWNIAGGGFIKLIVEGDSGVAVPIASRFTGELTVYAPDGVNSALVEVVSESPTVNATQQIYPETFAQTDDKFYLGTVHYSDYGDSDSQRRIKFLQDKRRFGAAYENEYKDKLSKSGLADALDSLRNNGVIRGLDYISNTSSTVKIRGGKALVSGNILEVETTDVGIDVSTDQTHLLILNEDGKFGTFDETDYGLSFDEIIGGDGYGDGYGVATILEFDVSGGSLGGTFIDRRLQIGNVDKRVDDLIQRIIALEAAVF